MDVNIWLDALVYCLTIMEIGLIFIYGISLAREPYAKGCEAKFQFGR